MTRKIFPSYLYSQDAVPGVVTTNVYVSLFNPVGSQKIGILSSVFLSSTLTNPSSIVTSMRGWRITSATGGTAVANTEFARLQTHWPEATLQVRIGNPTVTLARALFNSPAPVSARSSSVHAVELPAGSPPVLLYPGEGFCLRSVSQSTDAAWNITLAWAEGP